MKNHQSFKFGTFEERLAHACVVFEVDPPEIEYEDGHPAVSDPLVEWVSEHEINLDWLLTGDASWLLKLWSRDRKNEKRFIDMHRSFSPEIKSAFELALKGVVFHGLPVEEAMALVGTAVDEVRGQSEVAQ